MREMDEDLAQSLIPHEDCFMVKNEILDAADDIIIDLIFKLVK
jgi:hypothetical protein